MDETTAPVLDPGRGRTKTGFLWALARDDRGWGGADPPGVVYFYAPGRGGEHAEVQSQECTGLSGISCVGHDEGGRAWGRIAALIETAKINVVEPFAYLKATLEALANGHPNARLDDLLPWNFKAASS